MFLTASEGSVLLDVQGFFSSSDVFSYLSPAFGGRIQQPLTVVLVATHADLADIPRAFSGEFTYDKEKVLLKEVRNRLGPRQRSEWLLLNEL